MILKGFHVSTDVIGFNAWLHGSGGDNLVKKRGI